MRSPAARIDVTIEAPAWRGIDLRLLRRAAKLALTRGQKEAAVAQELTLLLSDDARLQSLNAGFRGKDKPTNVLAFPAAANADGYLGDVAIAFRTAEREAAEAGKPLAAHAAHLAVHGILHLLGYDHVRAGDARIMEPLETDILSELGIPDPYALHRASG
jgi:probable rRNA maturation factor